MIEAFYVSADLLHTSWSYARPIVQHSDRPREDMIWFESKFTISYREERGIYRKSISRTVKKIRIRLVGSFEYLRILANSTAI